MKRNRSQRRSGSALVMAVITMMVLMILAGALFMMFQMNTKSYLWQKEELQAMYTAEAGANLAAYMIVGGADVPQDSLPVQFLPDSGAGWFELPTEDLGRVRVFVDPDNDNAIVSSANAYAVRCLSRVDAAADAYTYGMETMLMPENFAQFSCFQENPGSGGFYDDGYVFDGPFHSNGPLCIFSGSPDHDNDPYFYSFNIARQTSGSGFYWYSEGGASNPTYVPATGNLEMQPYDRLLMGPPYFDLNVDSIPFGPSEVAWGNAREAAINGGLYFAPPPAGIGALASGTRMLLRNDTLIVKQSEVMQPDTFLLSTLAEPVVWIENGNTDNVYLKGVPGNMGAGYGVNIPVTIGMNGNLLMYGPHAYDNDDLLDPDNDDMLGLITVHGDFMIANDPDNTGGTDWPEPWEVVTDQPGSGGEPGGFNFSGVFMALDGQMRAQDHTMPAGAHDFYVVGGYIVYSEGYTGTTAPAGYTIRCSYDTRLMTTHPPYFPQTGNWDVIYWRDWPDLTEAMLDDDLI